MTRQPPLPAPERLLTIPESADLLQVSVKTIRRWIASGDLAAAKLGMQWRIRPQDLQRFVSRGFER